MVVAAAGIRDGAGRRAFDDDRDAAQWTALFVGDFAGDCPLLRTSMCAGKEHRDQRDEDSTLFHEAYHVVVDNDVSMRCSGMLPVIRERTPIVTDVCFIRVTIQSNRTERGNARIPLRLVQEVEARVVVFRIT